MKTFTLRSDSRFSFEFIVNGVRVVVKGAETMKPKQCLLCGRENRADNKACSGCGTPFKNPSGTMTVIVLTVLLVGIAFVAMTFMVKKKIAAHPQYQMPQIGMSMLDFENFCTNDGFGAAEMSRYETTNGTVWTLKLPFDEKRSARGCYGTFTFVGDELSSIAQ